MWLGNCNIHRGVTKRGNTLSPSQHSNASASSHECCFTELYYTELYYTCNHAYYASQRSILVFQVLAIDLLKNRVTLSHHGVAPHFLCPHSSHVMVRNVQGQPIHKFCHIGDIAPDCTNLYYVKCLATLLLGFSDNVSSPHSTPRSIHGGVTKRGNTLRF